MHPERVQHEPSISKVLPLNYTVALSMLGGLSPDKIVGFSNSAILGHPRMLDQPDRIIVQRRKTLVRLAGGAIEWHHRGGIVLVSAQAPKPCLRVGYKSKEVASLSETAESTIIRHRCYCWGRVVQESRGPNRLEWLVLDGKRHGL